MGLGLESIDFDWGNIQLLDQLCASDEKVNQCDVYVIKKWGPTIASSVFIKWGNSGFGFKKRG